MTWQAYGENLEERLKDLHEQGASGQLQSAPGQTDVYSEGRWRNAPAGHCDTAGIMHLIQFALGMVDEDGLS